MRRLCSLFVIFVLLCCCAGCGFHEDYGPSALDSQPSPEGSQPDHRLSTGLGDAAIWLDKSDEPWGRRESRIYVLPNGDEFHQIRLSFNSEAEETEVVLDSLLLPDTATMRRYSQESQQWFASPLGEGQISGGQYHISHEEGSLLLVSPQSYLPRENQMLQYLPQSDGYFRSRPAEKGWQLELCSPVYPGAQVECFYALSGEQLVDWQDSVAQELWANYDFTGDNRWCYDGYYYLAPENYIPSGENYYHRLSAAYIASQCAEKEGRICFDLALPMLHVMLGLQNDQGYFPTLAGSQWLLTDYGIGAGFYDTRFNSDLVEALLIMNERFHVPEFADAAMRYGQYYQSMAEKNHYALNAGADAETDAGADDSAWLVWDYAYEGCQPNHSSLNHQIAEILVLYRLYDLTGYEDYEDLANTLLRGILALGKRWLLPNNDLAYAYLPDASLGMQDYPYLTYNDLFDLCQALDQRYGSHDPLLDQLMSGKRQWMDKQGISGYKK